MSKLVRIDKNTVHNYLNFDVHGEQTGNIIRMLLLYFAQIHQYDFFGLGKLDQVKFSKDMSISLARLRSKTEKPYQLNGLTDQEIKALYDLQDQDPESFWIYDSNLENALYILLRSNILYPDNFKSKNTIRTNISSLTSVQVLKRLDIHFKNLKGGKKHLYTYELSKEFKNNLSTYFLHVRIDDVIKLKKPKLDGLYMHISNELQAMKANFVEMKDQDFDFLCAKAHINSKQQRDKKSRLKAAFERIKKDSVLNDQYWDYDFIKKFSDSKYEYKVMLINKSFYSSKIEKSKEYDKKFKLILEQDVFRECLDVFKNLYDGDEKGLPDAFNKWMKAADTVNKEEKILAHNTAYFRVKGSLPVYIKSIVNTWFGELSNLPNDYSFFHS